MDRRDLRGWPDVAGCVFVAIELEVGEQMAEEWRDVRDFPGYQVSSDGRVRTRRRDGWKQLRPATQGRGTGYLLVNLHKGGNGFGRLVHRFVLEAFVGPRPPGLVCRHHPDPNPANNRVENLRWGTAQENAADRLEHGSYARGEAHHNAKITAEDAYAIRAEFDARDRPVSAIARQYNVSVGLVNDIGNRRTWRHLSESPRHGDRAAVNGG